jgi:hypothetical protein
MGRYYEGDIEGKFWFGCQASDDGEFFGAKEQEPPFIEYSLSASSKHELHEGILKCKEALGDYLLLFDKAYSGELDNEPEWKNLDKKKQQELYKWFARLDMGMRMLCHFIENPEDECYFTAET